MKQIFVLMAGGLLLLSACTSPSVIVKTKKEPTRPYTRILAVYLEEGCDFSLFDSTAYNICLRSCFLKAEGFGLRNLVETRIQKHLATSGTKVLRSADFFDAGNCDYAYFRRTVDSLKVDAVLMVGLRSHSHEEHEMPIASISTTTDTKVTPAGPPGMVNIRTTTTTTSTNNNYNNLLGDDTNNSTLPSLTRYKTLNAFFVCDLLNPKSLYMPIWRAEIEEKGKRFVDDNGLNRNMTKKLAESLKGAHYIAH